MKIKIVALVVMLGIVGRVDGPVLGPAGPVHPLLPDENRHRPDHGRPGSPGLLPDLLLLMGWKDIDDSIGCLGSGISMKG